MSQAAKSEDPAPRHGQSICFCTNRARWSCSTFTSCTDPSLRAAAIAAAVEAVEREGRERSRGADAELHTNTAGHVAKLYRHRLRVVQEGDAGHDPQHARDTEREYRLIALRAERDTILRLGRRREIPDETARKLLREIDLVEARYR